LCASSEAAGSVSVLQGNGDGTFQAAVTYGSGGYNATSVAVADVNGDDIPDLVVSNYCSDSPCDAYGNTGVLFGNGDGTFQIAVPYDSGGAFGHSVAIADVNGDGKPDLLVANTFSSTVGVLVGNGDGTFQTAVTYGSGGNSAESVAAADVNGDGNADIVIVNACQSGSVSECTGNGTIGVLLDVPDFQIVANPTTITVIAAGQSGSTTLTITPLGGFNQTVSFTCSGLPFGANCSFVSTSGGDTMTITTVATSARFDQTVSPGKALFYAMLFPGFLGLVSVGAKRTRCRMRLLAVLCVVGFCLACLACSSSSSSSSSSGSGHTTGSGTPAGTSTVIVTAAAGSLSHQTAITLTVQ
jgi:hypothetical protein